MKIKTLALTATAILLLVGCNGGGESSSSTSTGEASTTTTTQTPAPITIEGNDFIVLPPYKDAGTVYHFDYTAKKLITKQCSTYGAYVKDTGYETEYDYVIQEFEIIATRKVYRKQGYMATSQYDSDMIVFFYEEKSDGSQGDLYRMKCDKHTANYDEAPGVAAKVYKVADSCWEDFKVINNKTYRCADTFNYSGYDYYLEFRFTDDYKIKVFHSKDGENWTSPYAGTGVEIPFKILHLEYLSTTDLEHTSSYGWDSRFTVSHYDATTNSFKVDKEAGSTSTGFVKLSFNSRVFTLVE